MRIKITTKPIHSKKTTIIPYNSSESTHISEACLSSFSVLKSVAQIDNGTYHLVDDKNKARSFEFVDLKKSQSLGIWIDTFQQWNQKKDDVQIDFRDEAFVTELRPLVQAIHLAQYDIAKFSSKKGKSGSKKSNPAISIIVSNNYLQTAKKILEEESILVGQQMEVMDLVNGPGNKVNAPYFNKWVRKSARSSGFKVRIFNKKQIIEKGLHALSAVNRGSEWDPSFIIAEYYGSKSPGAKTLGLVGKGVTFDTGGLSIKGSNNLHYMKSDMGGAAAVLGTISAVAALQWPVNIIAITPITDNCVDANAIKPGDVIDSYSGHTIEVINTDAEGRLILADALSYLVKNYETDHIIDLATLTGSSVRTFGTACAALFCNDEELEEQLFISGLDTAEKLWSLPLWDEYDDEMKSDIADIKNLATKPMAGAITAAKFLQFFTHEHPSWAHLDIAGTAFGETPFAKGKAATGYGVHLLCHFIQEHLCG